MAEYQEIFKTTLANVGELAKTLFGQAEESAKQDTTTFLNSMKADLETWALEFKNGQLSEADVKDLIEGRKDLAQMTLLKQAGLAAIKIDQFKYGVLDIVCKAVISKL